MKYLISILIFGLSFTLLGQEPSNDFINESVYKWVYFSGGNPIDGFRRDAFKINEEYQENLAMLMVRSFADDVRIENSEGSGDNDRDDVYVLIKGLEMFEGLEEILMYFDNSNKYFKVNYRGLSSNDIVFQNAISDSDEFLGRFNFINKLKSKREVFFRLIYTNGEKINLSFSLNGSSDCIKKVVDVSNTLKNEWVIDASISRLTLAFLMGNEGFKEIFGSNEYNEECISKIDNYLKYKFGKYYETFLWGYELDKANKCIEVSNMNGKVVDTIPYKLFYDD